MTKLSYQYLPAKPPNVFLLASRLRGHDWVITVGQYDPWKYTRDGQDVHAPAYLAPLIARAQVLFNNANVLREAVTALCEDGGP